MRKQSDEESIKTPGLYSDHNIHTHINKHIHSHTSHNIYKSNRARVVVVVVVVAGPILFIRQARARAWLPYDTMYACTFVYKLRKQLRRVVAPSFDERTFAYVYERARDVSASCRVPFTLSTSSNCVCMYNTKQCRAEPE